MTNHQPTTQKLSAEPPAALESSSLGRQVLLALGCGLVAALLWGFLFGLLSRMSILIGLVAGLGLGFVTAAAVLAPFKLLTRRLVWALFPVSVTYTLLGLLPLVLTPFLWVTLQRDANASWLTALRLSWAFYKLMVVRLSSSSLITGLTVAGSVVGYIAVVRLNELRRTGG